MKSNFLRRLLVEALRRESTVTSGVSRRAFLGSAALGLAAAACGPVLSGRDGPDGDGPTIVIIGAGLAGLAACDRLRQHGVRATVIEARNRVGGRVLSNRTFGAWKGHQRAVECGAEFIDTQHIRMLRLAREFELELLDVETLPERERVFQFGGRRLDEAAIVDAFEPIAKAMVGARKTLGQTVDSIGHEEATPAARALDSMSLADFIHDAGASEVARALIASAYGTEFGLAIEDQSALNLFAMLEEGDFEQSQSDGELALFGASDERFRVLGGNDRIATELGKRNDSAISTGQAFVGARQRGDGRFELMFDGGATRIADIVICTVPFGVLRQLELNIPMSAVKRRVIDELGYGLNSKLIVPFERPIWEDAGDNGSIFGERELLAVWAPLEGQGPGRVALTQFLAGSDGAAMTAATHEGPLLAGLEKVWPGIGGLRSERSSLAFPWGRDPWALGSYACYRPGQWTTIAGAEGEAAGDGRFLFAGEHVSGAFQGFMEGAVETGEAAADAVLTMVGRGRKTH